MAKAQLKTKPTGISVAAFVGAVEDEGRRKDCGTVLKLMKQATKAEPKMWGPSIVGFGTYHYKYDSGREGTSCRAGFSPRKAALTFYGFGGADDSAQGAALLERLGKHSRGKGCLYIKKLTDVDLAVLEALIARTWSV